MLNKAKCKETHFPEHTFVVFVYYFGFGFGGGYQGKVMIRENTIGKLEKTIRVETMKKEKKKKH